MKARLLFSILAVLALGTAPAAAQGLLGNLTGGLINVNADRDDSHTNADVIIGGDNSNSVLNLGYGEVGGETGNASIGIADFADLGGAPGLGELPGLLPGLLPGAGDNAPVPTPIPGGGGGTGGGSFSTQLAFLASLMDANSCGVTSASNVVVVDISTWLAPREMAGLGSVIASNAGEIAVCQAMLSRAAALLGLSPTQLSRVIAVDIRGSNVVLYMA
jgi:hypothetical protein